MKISEKINMDINGLIANGPITIVAFGDSVTHGALRDSNDYENVYWNLLKKKLNAFRDSIPVNVINSGIGGISAALSIERMERDVLSYHPDLVIVCFGLNDVNGTLEEYVDSLRVIFKTCKDSGAEVIFLTPNMLNTYVADDAPEQYKAYAAVTAEYQNNGRMDLYMSSAVATAQDCGVGVCDCYGEWKKLYEKGVDTTMLLVNRINHPESKMHELFADMLYAMVMGESVNDKKDYVDGMYKDGNH